MTDLMEALAKSLIDATRDIVGEKIYGEIIESTDPGDTMGILRKLTAAHLALSKPMEKDPVPDDDIFFDRANYHDE